MAFGEMLKKLREQHELTQTELAEQVGIKQPTVAQYEAGLKVPSVITGVRIAGVLHTSCEEMVSTANE